MNVIGFVSFLLFLLFYVRPVFFINVIRNVSFFCECYCGVELQLR